MARIVCSARTALAVASLAAASFVAPPSNGLAAPPATRPSADTPAVRPAAEIVADRVPLDTFLDSLRDRVPGLNLAINWPALEAAGIDRSTPITMRLRNASVRRVLDLALRQTGGPLAWYVDGDVVVVTSRDLADRAMITRVYPVQDLVMEVPDFYAPDVQLGTSGNGGTGGTQSIFAGGTNANRETTVARAERGEQLAELVRTLIRPDVWIENGGYASVRYFAGNLIVTAPRDVQNQIGR